MSTQDAATEEISPEARRKERTALVGAVVGNSLEWFDFFVYGTASALVFGPLFFPDIDPAAGVLASFATLWVGFLTRPLGGIVFGHLGDRFGRKNVLMVTLVLMGASTTAIGLLPTYAQVGVLAPVLLVLLRAFQGLAVGGEWGGAVLIATESARASRKTIAGAWVQQGSPIGSLMATGSFLLVGMLPDDAFFGWGWRLPFLFSVVLIVVGVVLRLRVTETQEFLDAKKREQQQSKPAKAPALEVIRTAPLILVFGIFASIMSISISYFTNTFMLAWTTGPLGFDRQLILNILVGASVVQFFTQLAGGYLAQRFGRARIILIALAIALVGTVPYFLAIDQGNLLFIALMIYVSYGSVCMYFAVFSSFLAYSFPARVRYSGMSIAYQVCSALIGGSTAFVAQWILTVTGNNPWAVSIFYTLLLVLTIVGVIGLRSFGTHRRGDVSE
ncbi:MFS transporter [Gulosibacter sp. 10]|uniref:MFS transporter n=1 Tax=Gulosibacter sp. 10 TaxID=1255570 RepID=UPI00097F1C20|nr:MFS transporter [Gulosibacter sp. 10]SJM56206.1 Transporter, MFS superfamily [Gulosibacter sp. 10]